MEGAFRGALFLYQFIIPMHEVVPKVVAIAVRIVIAKWMIFCQRSFLFIVDGCLVGVFLKARITRIARIFFSLCFRSRSDCFDDTDFSRKG